MKKLLLFILLSLPVHAVLADVLRWDAVPGATGYRVWCIVAQNSDYLNAAPISVSVPSYQLSLPDGSWHCAVSAVSMTAESPLTPGPIFNCASGTCVASDAPLPPTIPGYSWQVPPGHSMTMIWSDQVLYLASAWQMVDMWPGDFFNLTPARPCEPNTIMTIRQDSYHYSVGRDGKRGLTLCTYQP